MFAIITQLQLPQSCRHSNGAGRPSQAAKWQVGEGWHEPRAQPHRLPLSAPQLGCPLPRG